MGSAWEARPCVRRPAPVSPWGPANPPAAGFWPGEGGAAAFVVSPFGSGFEPSRVQVSPELSLSHGCHPQVTPSKNLTFSPGLKTFPLVSI